MATPALIYCADGNPRFAGIAITAGFLYGAQLPNTIYYPPYFCDQDWKRPDKAAYLTALAEHRPHMATVLDLEHRNQLGEVLGWVEEAAAFVEVIIIIPKVSGIIAQLPHLIRGREVRLGYSVPTGYGGTAVPVQEFMGWPVHLLGGSPQAQMKLAGVHFQPRPKRAMPFLSKVPRLNVVSADGNMAMLMAKKHCQFWEPGTARYARNHYWPTLREAEGQKWGDGSAKADAPYEAFRRSCENIMMVWQGEHGKAQG